MLVDVVTERRRAVVIVPGRIEVRDGVRRARDDRAAGRGAAGGGLSDAGADGRCDERHEAAERTEAPSPTKSTHEFLFLLSLEDVPVTGQPPTYWDVELAILFGGRVDRRRIEGTAFQTTRTAYDRRSRRATGSMAPNGCPSFEGRLFPLSKERLRDGRYAFRGRRGA